MISHDNYTFICDTAARATGMWTPEREGKIRLLSLLPLSHVAAQLVDLIIAIRGGANVFFTDPSALQGNLAKFLHACRPYFTFYLELLLSPCLEYGKRWRKK